MIVLLNRIKRNGHRSGIIWFTGLSGSGKTTLASALERCLFDKGCQVIVLDGDNLRRGISNNLGFNEKDREENIRRVVATSEVFIKRGMLVVTAFISPYERDRIIARNKFGADFKEIFLDPGLETCEKRDPKGLYKKAREGAILNFTGISDPYEPPKNPALRIDTAVRSIGDCSAELCDFVFGAFNLSK